MNMNLTKSLGMLLLGIWLIVTGLLTVLSVGNPDRPAFYWLCWLSLLVFLSCWVGRLFGFSDYGHVNSTNHGNSVFLFGLLLMGRWLDRSDVCRIIL